MQEDNDDFGVTSEDTEIVNPPLFPSSKLIASIATAVEYQRPYVA